MNNYKPEINYFLLDYRTQGRENQQLIKTAKNNCFCDKPISLKIEKTNIIVGQFMKLVNF
jgi:hypothetical protein